jgi:drug/metabolite transporter (DMT)-like permease
MVMANKKHNKIKAIFLLTLTAFIWGMGFVAQKSGMDYVGPFLFSGLRLLLGSLTMLVCIQVQRIFSKPSTSSSTSSWAKSQDPLTSSEVQGLDSGTSPRMTGSTSVAKKVERSVFKGGIACGAILFFAANTQQVGMYFTTAAKTGFLTALYIILVPIFAIFLHKKTHWNLWVSVFIAAVGLYFLSITGEMHMQIGDLVVLSGAIGWALHIFAIDYYSPHLSGTGIMKLCMWQFFWSGLFGLICAPIFDSFFTGLAFSFKPILNVMPALLYSGIGSTGAGFTLQAIGQKYASPSMTAIILSMEAVFSAIGGVLILHEVMSGREVLGSILMFSAVILTQIPVKSKA